MWQSQRDFLKEPLWRRMSTLGSKPPWNSQLTLSTDPAAWGRRPIGTMCMGGGSGQTAVPLPHCPRSQSPPRYNPVGPALSKHWLGLREKAYFLWQWNTSLGLTQSWVEFCLYCFLAVGFRQVISSLRFQYIYDSYAFFPGYFTYWLRK